MAESTEEREGKVNYFYQERGPVESTGPRIVESNRLQDMVEVVNLDGRHIVLRE